MDGLMIDSERLYFQAEEDMAKKFNIELKEETLWKMMGTKPIEGLPDPASAPASSALTPSGSPVPVACASFSDSRSTALARNIPGDLR